MSYILDALRKADSERERGAVPGLHAQSGPVGSDDASARSGPPWWAWLIVAAFVLLLTVLGWLLLERDVPAGSLPAATPTQSGTSLPPAPLATAALSSAPAASAAIDAPAALPAIAPPASPAAPAATSSATPLAAPPPPAPPAVASPAPPAKAAPNNARSAPDTTAQRERRTAKPDPIAKSAAKAAARDKPDSRADKRSGAAGANHAGAAKGSTAGASEDSAAAGGPIYQFNDLPEGLRRELPRLPIGGSIHSSKAADRLLIINGQLFHEGDELAPGLMLDQIQLKSAVLRYKGYRYRVSF
jgi:general secretion pathway protein B